MGARAFSILNAIGDKRLFGAAFKDASTWAAWFTFLAGLFGLPLSAAEAQVWRECTGRESLPQKPFSEAWPGVRSAQRQVIAVFLSSPVFAITSLSSRLARRRPS